MPIPVLLLIVSLAAPAPAAVDHASALRQQAERAWAQRSLGFREHGVPDRAPVESAIAAWRGALELEPGDLPTRFALIEALWFAGQFVETGADARRRRFEEQLDLAIATRDLVAAAAGGGDPLADLDPDQRARRLAGVPGAVDAEFWSAISWGVWGMSHSRLTAARRGVAERIREHAELLGRLDPGFADGAADRLLGRLHTATPKVPLVTGWLDRGRGIELLRAANARSTRDGRNPLFLAEALLRHQPRFRDEALALLREVACRRPDPAALVEESETIDAARARLAAETGASLEELDRACPTAAPAPTEAAR